MFGSRRISSRMASLMACEYVICLIVAPVVLDSLGSETSQHLPAPQS